MEESKKDIWELSTFLHLDAALLKSKSLLYKVKIFTIKIIHTLKLTKPIFSFYTEKILTPPPSILPDVFQSNLSNEKATIVRIEAFMTVSVIMILASQAISPKGQGYCFHIRYNSLGIPSMSQLISTTDHL